MGGSSNGGGFTQLASRYPHFAMTALMGTAKHLRERHGVQDPPTGKRDLAQAHVDTHGGWPPATGFPPHGGGSDGGGG